MTGWTRHGGQAVALDRENVDTDQLIPARFMSTPRSEGYGEFLLHDMRRDGDGTLLPDFPLNATPGASLLVAGRNFGSGSSREAAVYALVDFGIRAVIAPSFGDIFAANAVNNGLLPARVREEDAVALIAALAAGPREMAVDIATCRIALGARELAFDLDATWREKLVNGWDDIDLTRKHTDRIAAFRARHIDRLPGAIPADEIT